MSIQSEITRLSGNVSDALDAIEAKGVTIPTGANSDDLANLIGQISGGGGGTGTITQDENGYLVLSPDGGGGGGSEPGICVCGTFTTGTTGGVAQTISIPYSGSGYPFLVTISLAEGVENQSGTAYGTLHAYAITQATYCKASTSTLPNYTGGSSNNNLASRFIRYKSSTTNPGTTTTAQSTISYLYDTASASNSVGNVLKFNSNNQLSLYIAGESPYGFLPNTQYSYCIGYIE